MTDKTQAETLRQEYRATMPADVLHIWAKDALLLIDSLERYRYAYNEWSEKTEWVQETVQPKEHGMHRADILRARIAELEARQAAPPAPAAVAVPAPAHDCCNSWFASLSEGRQAVLRDDKWMLAHAAFDAGRAALAAAPAQAVAVPSEVDLPDVEDMAHSAVQEALSFGVNHDVFHRWMRAVMDKTVQALAVAPAQAMGVPIELQGVQEVVEQGSGFWRSCTGCHELNEGHDTGPVSKVFGCALGNGCSECGGIGAVWDDIDYGAMADAMAAPAQEHATQLAGQGLIDAARDLSALRTEYAQKTHDAMPGNEYWGARFAAKYQALDEALAAAPAQAQEDARDEWEGIDSLPNSDDLIWLYCQDTNTTDGPVIPSPSYADSWTHWAFAEAPSTAAIDAARAAQGGAA